MSTLFKADRDGQLAVLGLSSEDERERFVEFFAASIRNHNTRQAYYRAVRSFLTWVGGNGVPSLNLVRPIHVATWVEWLATRCSPATVKLQLAALKVFFDWMVVNQSSALNPAASVRSPRLVVRKGKTPVLDREEARQLLRSIDISSTVGLRDRALIGTMIFSFARIGAALSMRVDDVYVQNRRLWIRLHEKGGKRHDMPCHHELEDYLDTYMAAGQLRTNPDGWLFPSVDRRTKRLGVDRLQHANAYAMVKRRALRAGVSTRICNHSFRATGITAYLLSGGTLEIAARMANHASTRTTQLYDRRDDGVTLSEIERIRL
jgi:site-specific recombinase XerD